MNCAAVSSCVDIYVRILAQLNLVTKCSIIEIPLNLFQSIKHLKILDLYFKTSNSVPHLSFTFKSVTRLKFTSLCGMGSGSNFLFFLHGYLGITNHLLESPSIFHW